MDLEHLRRFTFGDQALEREILNLFLAQLPETIMALRSAECDRDWKTAAHTLKGSSRAVGAWRVATLAEEAEGFSRDRSRDACDKAVLSLEDAAAEVRAFIEAGC